MLSKVTEASKGLLPAVGTTKTSQADTKHFRCYISTHHDSHAGDAHGTRPNTTTMEP